MLEKIENVLIELGKKMLSWREEAIEGHWEGSQLKTKADMDAHYFLVDALTKLALEIPIISEENEDNHSLDRPMRYFIIDPIDGTASFAGGFKGFVTQIAYIENKEVKIGVVYAPALNELFSAEKGKGAFLNHKPLKLEDKLNKTIRLIDNYPEPRGVAEKIFKGLPCNEYVEFGSLGLKICKIADGTANLFVKDVILKDWDVAAADLILKEAGGYFARLNGSAYLYDGSYYKQGIIACATLNIAEKMNKFYQENLSEAV